eukprot:4317224-Pleurochrysis_carterae.AAC.4
MSAQTYSLRPDFKHKFRPAVVKTVIASVLAERLSDKIYNAESTAGLTREISDEIKSAPAAINSSAGGHFVKYGRAQQYVEFLMLANSREAWSHPSSSPHAPFGLSHAMVRLCTRLVHKPDSGPSTGATHLSERAHVAVSSLRARQSAHASAQMANGLFIRQLRYSIRVLSTRSARPSNIFETAQVVIGEQRGEGVRMGARCFWDTDTDSYAEETYRNDSLFCVAAAFGVYLY